MKNSLFERLRKKSFALGKQVTEWGRREGLIEPDETIWVKLDIRPPRTIGRPRGEAASGEPLTLTDWDIIRKLQFPDEICRIFSILIPHENKPQKAEIMGISRWSHWDKARGQANATFRQHHLPYRLTSINPSQLFGTPDENCLLIYMIKVVHS